MLIIDPSIEVLNPVSLNHGIEMLKFIEKLGRISHRSEDKQTSDSWKKFIKAVVIDHGDMSIIEHSSASVMFRMDRAICMEMVRHRLFSYTMESTRFVSGRKSYPNGLEFIMPINLCKDKEWRFRNSCILAEEHYLNMLDEGVRPQEARSVLPNSLAATIAVTGNLRNWRHFLLMRTSKETHPDFRRVTIPLLAEFKNRIPLLYDDIEPEQRQIDNLKKAR
jgi:thymidylate synthase (FAD)